MGCCGQSPIGDGGAHDNIRTGAVMIDRQREVGKATFICGERLRAAGQDGIFRFVNETDTDLGAYYRIAIIVGHQDRHNLIALGAHHRIS